MALYTDIAAEIYPKTKGSVPRGVKFFTSTASGILLTRVDILRTGLRRPKGCYITLDMPDFACIDDQNEAYVLAIASQLRNMLPREGTVLVAGIGNRNITADALGAQTAERVFATRELPKTQQLLALRDVAACACGVAAQTGITTTEFLSGLVRTVQPSAVLCVDSLCTSDARRLGCSVQLSTAGLHPQAAQPLCAQTLGVPVVALGVPTVMQAHPTHKDKPLVVTPRDIDNIVLRGANLLALAINKALQPALRVEELVYIGS